MRYKNNYADKIKKYVTNKNLTYCIDTMGCQMNENDSAKYKGILEEMGFKEASQEKANLILFNTCCVRENAENTLFGRLGFLKKKKTSRRRCVYSSCWLYDTTKTYFRKNKKII